MAKEGSEESSDETEEEVTSNDDSVGEPTLTDSQIFDLIKTHAQRIAELRGRPLLYLLYPYASMLETPHGITVYNLFRDHPREIEDLDVLVHSRGGDIHEAYDITKLCQSYSNGDVTLFVPLEAMSATTLLALGVDEVVLSEIGKVGPLDPQVLHPENGRYMPVQSVTDVPKILEEALNTHTREIQPEVKGEAIIKPIAEQVDPYYLTGNDEKSQLAKQYGERLLRRRGITGETVDRCLETLVSEYPAHAFSIDYHEIQTNPDLKNIINAKQIKELDDGSEIERLMIEMAELFIYWDFKYLDTEPRQDVKIELFDPDSSEQSQLGDLSDEIVEEEEIDPESSKAKAEQESD